MSAPIPKAALRAMEDQITAAELAQAHARIARLGARIETVMLKLTLTLAATLGCVVVVAQLVKWIAR